MIPAVAIVSVLMLEPVAEIVAPFPYTDSVLTAGSTIPPPPPPVTCAFTNEITTALAVPVPSGMASLEETETVELVRNTSTSVTVPPTEIPTVDAIQEAGFMIIPTVLRDPAQPKQPLLTIALPFIVNCVLVMEREAVVP